MKNRDSKDWLWPPADQWITVWGLLVIGVVSLLTGQFLLFFSRLTGMAWIWCYGLAMVVATVGLSLILYAKFPLYQERRFFTFGSRAVPESRRSFYRWGFRCVTFGGALLLCLCFSKP